MNRRFLWLCLSLCLALAPFAGWLWLPPSTLAWQEQTSAAVRRYVSLSGQDQGTCTTPAAPCRTVQYAIDQAAEGDELLLASGTFTGTQAIGAFIQVAYLEKSLTLRGGYTDTFRSRDALAYTTTLDAAGEGRVLYASGAFTVTLDGLRLVNGDWKNDGSKNPAGGCVYSQDTSLRLQGVTIQGCTTPHGLGSGLYQLRGSLVVSDSLIQNNSSTVVEWGARAGGGVYAGEAQVEIISSQILSNTAAVLWDLDGKGGGVALENCQAVIRTTRFQGNIASYQTGGGGGLYASGGSLRLLNNVFVSNQASADGYGAGGGAALGVNGAILDGNQFINNVSHHIVGSGINGWGGGVTIGNSLGVTVTNNLFQGNFSYWGGAFFANYGRSLLFTGNRLIANAGRSGGGLTVLGVPVPGGLSSRLVVRDNLFQGNTAIEKGGGAYLVGPVHVWYNRFIANRAVQEGGGVYQDESSRSDTGQALYDGNDFQSNSAASGGGLMLKPVFSPDLDITYQNLVFRGNTASSSGAAIYVHKYSNKPIRFNHFTLSANPGGEGMIYIISGNVVISNTTLYSATVGVWAHSCVSMDHVLRHKVTTPVFLYNIFGCPPGDHSPLNGEPALAADGIHLTAASAAVDTGGPSGVRTDFDGEPRPLGSGPDVGADESPYSRTPAGVQAALLPGEAHWMAYYTGVNKPPSTFFQQDYLLPFAYSALPTASQITHYTLQDTFPTAMDLTSVIYRPAMTYTHNGSALTWQSRAPLAAGDFGWIGLVGQSWDIAGGTSLETSGQMQYTFSNGENGTIPFHAQTTVPPRPMFAPVLLTPNDGEMCLDDASYLTAVGLASVGQTVRLYENGILKAQTQPDQDGHFELNWPSSLDNFHPVRIQTQSCTTTGQCSPYSRQVNLTLAKGDWCPQRSYWEGDAMGAHFTFYFRDEHGRYASDGFVIPGASFFNNTFLHLYSCCQGDTNPFRVTADGIDYPLPVSHSGRMWTFNIAYAHNVVIESTCARAGGKPPVIKRTTGQVLIDPDGFAFDASQGGAYDPLSGMFAPAQPLPGVTVTAYYSAPEWGGWIIWPAHLFNSQVNPQRTGENGYYAFFTPPGFYYLQADPGPNSSFQPWRSPIIQVITQIVHANAPLTLLPPVGSEPEVILAPQGAFPARLTIPPGSSVVFRAAPGPLGSVSDLLTLTANPLTRLLSSLDPLVNPLGFDSGLLVPGATYRRRFTTTGIYPYSCGPGCSGSLSVSMPGIYIPSLSR